jgi:serine/threonine-protein kinase
MSATSNVGPFVTLAAAVIVGAGLLTADALTDPARTRAETPAVVAQAATSAPTTAAATTDTTAVPSPTTTTASASTTVAATTPATAAAYLSAAVYVGRDAARRTNVAVAVRDGKVAAYVCDGRAVESWLTGTAAGTTATLTAGADRLVTEVVPGALHVTGTVHGRPVDVTAALGSAPAGLYRLDAANGTTVGWIVQPDGTQVGLRSRAGVVGPAPVLVPGQAVTLDGQQAYPQEVSGDDRF